MVTGLFTYYQENKSSKIMESFAKMTPPLAMVKTSFKQFVMLMFMLMAQVVRDGAMKEIEASELVVGDIVEIHGGDKTPADIRMLECHSIKVIACLVTKILNSIVKVDNSSFTGESVPVSLRPDISDPNHLESRNLAFYSTNVVEGVGRGVVIKTGDETVMGSIAGLVASLDSGKTPINKEVE